MGALTTPTITQWVNEANPLGPPANASIDTQLNASTLNARSAELWNAVAAESDALQTYANNAAAAAQGAAEDYADGPLAITVKTGNYTLTLNDRATRIEVTAAATITIPSIASGVAWLPGHWVEIGRMGSGAVSIAQGSGVTLRPASPIAIATQYESVRVLMTASNDVWVGTT